MSMAALKGPAYELRAVCPTETYLDGFMQGVPSLL